MSLLPYSVKLTGGEVAEFSTFDDALSYGCRIVGMGFAVSAIVNNNRADGDKRQGLTEDEYLQALEVCS